MGQSKGEAAKIAVIIGEAKASIVKPEKPATFQDGTTYVQYVISDAETAGHIVLTPTRRWTQLPDGTVLVHKQLGSAVVALAQKQAAHQLGFCKDLGVVAEAKETPEATLGFGTHDRAFEVETTEGVVKMLALGASMSGEDHVSFFKGKTERRKAERKAYQTLSDPTIAALVEELRKQA